MYVVLNHHNLWHLTLAGVSRPTATPPQTADTGQPPSTAHGFTQCKVIYLTTSIFTQQWDRACGKRFPSTKPDWIPSIEDRSGHFAMDHLSRFKTMEPTYMLRFTGKMMTWCSPPFTQFRPEGAHQRSKYTRLTT
jgi:hypothetical protein